MCVAIEKLYPCPFCTSFTINLYFDVKNDNKIHGIVVIVCTWVQEMENIKNMYQNHNFEYFSQKKEALRFSEIVQGSF